MLGLMQDALELKELKVPKWPFFLGDATMLGLAYYIYWQAGRRPLDHWELTALGVCAALGAVLGVLPFLLEYRAALKYGALVKLIETSSLCAAAEKISSLESCVAQITSATDQLQSAQSHADKTAGIARDLSDRMAAEAREFTAFLQKANDSEKSALRLETEKLRRAEADWLGVLVHIFDHVFALTRAAERSGQANVIKQLQQFQQACREAARRVGLTPLGATPGEAFAAPQHRLPEGGDPPQGATIDEVLAPGFTFQSQLLRPVLVQVRNGSSPQPPTAEAQPAAEVELPQGQLPLGSSESPAL